jgi:hypothetical protein
MIKIGPSICPVGATQGPAQRMIRDRFLYNERRVKTKVRSLSSTSVHIEGPLYEPLSVAKAQKYFLKKIPPSRTGAKN